MTKHYFIALFTLLTSATLWGQGAALDFDGTDDYVQTSYFGLAGSFDRTVEAWVKTTANCVPNQGGRQQTILDHGTFSTGGRFTFCLLWSNSVRLEVGGNGVSGTTPVNDGNWHHVAAVYTGSNNQVTLYVDGVQDAQATLTVNANTGSLNPVMIGKRVDDVNYFTGSIDEVRYYTTARSAAEILADYNAEYCATPAQLGGYWKFNEGVPNGMNTTIATATDYAGSNNGSLSGFTLNGTTSNWVTGALTPAQTTTSSLSANACLSYTSPSGQVWTSSGTYVDTIPNAAGCDSIITVQLALGASTSSLSATACDEYPFNGQLLTTSGTYVDTLTGAQGCDSVVTLNLTVNNSIMAVDTLTGCDSVWYAGAWYFSTLDTMLMGSTSAGCDSTVQLHIAVNAIQDSVYVSDGVAYAIYDIADSYTWIDCATQQPVPNATSPTFTPTQSGDYAVIITQGNCSDTSSCTTIAATPTRNVAPSFDFTIAPNPSAGQFVVQLTDPTTVEQYQVFNAFGQLVQQAAITQSTFTLDLPLSSGLYFLQVRNRDGHTATKRLLIK